MPNAENEVSNSSFDIVTFGIRHSAFGIRHSPFAIRHSPLTRSR
jgi:hypothetical protein